MDHETVSGDKVKIQKGRNTHGEKVVTCARVNAEERVPAYAALETCPVSLALKGKGIRECDFEVRDL